MSTFVESISQTIREDRAWTHRWEKPPMLVSVQFESVDHTLSYYCDDLSLKVGDVVVVDGMLSYEIGIVTDVKLDYATPPYNMKWIREIVNAELQGHYFEDGVHMVSLNGTLSPRQYAAMALGFPQTPRFALSSTLSFGVSVDCFDYDARCTVVEVFKGRMAYEDGAVTYLSLDEDGHGHAFFRYTNARHGGYMYGYIPFYYRNGWVYFETSERTKLNKQEIAILFQLRSVLAKITSNNKSFVLCAKQDFARILDYATGHVDITYNYKD